MDKYVVANLYRHMMREMFGIAEDITPELVKLGPSLARLRESDFSSSTIDSAIYHFLQDSDSSRKQAYVLGYLPSYSFQAGFALQKAFHDDGRSLWRRGRAISMVTVGGGPLPELIALVDHCIRHRNPQDPATVDIHLLALDINTDWIPHCTATANIASRLLKERGQSSVKLHMSFDSIDLTRALAEHDIARFRGCNIITLQNVLNEIRSGERDIAVANIVKICRSMDAGSKLILSDLIEYDAVRRSFALIEQHIANDTNVSLQKFDFPKSSAVNETASGAAGEDGYAKSGLRSPFWAAGLGTEYSTSPIPTPVSKHFIGHFADGGSRARRNLYCGFRIFEKSLR